MANEFRAKLDEERRKAAQPAPLQRLAPRVDDVKVRLWPAWKCVL